jgi:hypothetical protein
MRTHPIESTAIATLAAIRLARIIVVPVVALILTMAGWQPAQTSQPQPAAAPMAAAPATDWADGLTVKQLRDQARTVGLRSLARSGRRSDLIAALAIASVTV